MNTNLSQLEIRKYCALEKKDEQMLESAMVSLKLSIRAYFRILKITRTIADLDGVAVIESAHLLEAIGYRKFGRSL